MAEYESKVKRNGVTVSVQYLLMKQHTRRPEVKLHYHEYAELLYGVSGVARVVVGGKSIELSPDTMVLVYPNDPHDVVYQSGECAYHVVKFLPQVLLADEQSFPEYAYVFLLMEQLHNRRVFFDRGELEQTDIPEIFGRIKQEWVQQEFGHELSLRADVTRLFLYILRRWREDNAQLTEEFLLSAKSELMQKAVSFVQKHYADITEEQTAEACGVSPSYLSRSFKKHMRTSFSEYVNSVRLREARRLLLTTDESVTDIAQTVGFSTSAYFIAKFRALHGTTPHRFRTESKGEA